MQIHELNNFTGTLGSGAYLAIDDGNDTGKISSQGLLAATEARIDNIIAGPAPSAEEIVDARLGADGVTYPSLGDAIRDQFTNVKSDLSDETSARILLAGRVTTAESDIDTLETHKVAQPLDGNNQPTNGTDGQSLRTKGDGTTEWVDMGLPTDEQTAQAVSDWLDEHPEATTTVQDGSLTEAKFSNALKLETINDYVTPEMFGAVGDGVTDDTDAWEQAIQNSNYIVCFEKNYKLTRGLVLDKPITIECVTTQRRPNQRYYLDFSSMDTGSCLTLSNTTGVSLKNINILGSRGATTGINCTHAYHCNLDNIGVYSQAQGLYLDWAWDYNLQNCIFDDCDYCVAFIQAITTISFLNCIFYNSTVGIQAVKSVIGSSLVNCAFDTCDKCIILIADYTNDLGLYNCSFESYIKGVDVRGTSTCVISSCFFQENLAEETILGEGTIVLIGGHAPLKIASQSVVYLNDRGLENSTVIDGRFVESFSRNNNLKKFGPVSSLSAVNIKSANDIIVTLNYTNCSYFVGEIKYVNESSQGASLIFGLRNTYITAPSDSSVDFVNDSTNKTLTIKAKTQIAFSIDIRARAGLELG